MKIEQIIQRIEDLGLTIENKKLFKAYLSQSIFSNKKITFYDFECPPRKIVKINGKEYIDYQMDLKKIFSREKSDEFTELPKSVEHRDLETKLLSELKQLGIQFQYVKIIADTNLLYITPETLDIIDKERNAKIFRLFKQMIAQSIRTYPVKSKVKLFSELFNPIQKEYDDAFDLAMSLLLSQRLISKKTFDSQIERTRKHVGIEDKKNVETFSIRTIATYAAEGVVFDLLSRTTDFSNCVWLNLYETDKRTVEITNCLRKNRKMPMLRGNISRYEKFLNKG